MPPAVPGGGVCCPSCGLHVWTRCQPAVAVVVYATVQEAVLLGLLAPAQPERPPPGLRAGAAAFFPADRPAEEEAAGNAARELAAAEATEEAARNLAERAAAESAARDLAEREAAAQAARELAEKEAAEQAARELAEDEAAEQAARKLAEETAAEDEQVEEQEEEPRSALPGAASPDWPPPAGWWTAAAPPPPAPSPAAGPEADSAWVWAQRRAQQLGWAEPHLASPMAVASVDGRQPPTPGQPPPFGRPAPRFSAEAWHRHQQLVYAATRQLVGTAGAAW